MIRIMGAGKGKIKRVRSLSTPSSSLKNNEVSRQDGKLLDWISQLGIRNTTIGDYYLGIGRAKQNRAMDEMEKEFVLQELFRDAIDCEAIHFKNPVNPDDFQIKMRKTPGKPRLQEIHIEYAPQGKTLASGAANFYVWCISPTRKMSSLRDPLYYLWYALQNVIRNAK